jgi:ADP-ribosyl-[dinitrogen reductase] hydrolase
MSKPAPAPLLGLAVGDAVGTTVEFSPRGSFEPLTDMIGGGPFGLKPGQWTDDTSMALCLAESLVECGAFDPTDQMQRYVRWYRQGHLSPTGHCFDIGVTVHSALFRFEQDGDPFSGSTDPMSAGNGSIMRLAPVVLRYHPDRGEVDRYAAESSRTTHGAEEAVAGCRILAGILCALMDGVGKQEAVLAVSPADWMSPALQAIAAGGYREKMPKDIRGSGYVVESLEAALWCFWTTDSFRDAVLTAANLGDDADTTAAVCGQLAGACYGREGIPEAWLEKLAMREYIEELSAALIAAGRRG